MTAEDGCAECCSINCSVAVVSGTRNGRCRKLCKPGEEGDRVFHHRKSIRRDSVDTIEKHDATFFRICLSPGRAMPSYIFMLPARSRSGEEKAEGP